MKTLALIALLNTYVTGQYVKGGIVGVVLNDKTEVVRFGETNSFHSKVADEKTIFEIGSITKAMTGIILASLVHDNIVELNDPIEKFIPDLKDAPAGKITLVELSTHTSSLPRIPSNMASADPLNPYQFYNERKLLTFLKDIKIENHPVEFSWKNYSNLAVGLLGYTLEKASSLTYEELLQKYIAKPLGMNNTTTILRRDQTIYKAKKYNPKLEKVPYWGFDVLVAAGGIRSNLEDMLKLLKNMMNLESSPIGVVLKKAINIQYCEKEKCIGLGWSVYKSELLKLVSHNGSTAGFTANFQFRTDKTEGFVSLSSGSEPIDCLEEVILFKISCTPDLGVLVPDDILNSYEGEYGGMGMSVKISKIGDHLVYDIIGQEMGNLKSISHSKFSAGGVANFEFANNNTLTITQDDVVFTLTKRLDTFIGLTN